LEEGIVISGLTPRRLGASLAIAGLAAATGTGTIANASQSSPGVQVVVSCTTTAQGGSCTITFQFNDANGNPETGIKVTFTVSGVTGASVNPTSGTTDPGQVSTTFNAGTSGCGTATITASGNNGQSGQTTVNVPCGSSGSLPNTSAPAPSAPLWPAGLGGLAVLTLIGGAVYLRRTHSTS
jgi:hypothetical protein